MSVIIGVLRDRAPSSRAGLPSYLRPGSPVTRRAPRAPADTIYQFLTGYGPRSAHQSIASIVPKFYSIPESRALSPCKVFFPRVLYVFPCEGAFANILFRVGPPVRRQLLIIKSGRFAPGEYGMLSGFPGSAAIPQHCAEETY